VKIEREDGLVGIPLYQVDFGICFFRGNGMDVWMKISPPYSGEETPDEYQDDSLYAVNLNYGLADRFDPEELVQPIAAKVVITTKTNIKK